jgi:UDP-glucose 4-epimerase
MNILVTGGAGYIGSHTVKELIKRGFTIYVIDNLSRGHSEAVPADILYTIDLSDKDALYSFFREKSIDTVIHFAAFAYISESVDKPLLYYQNNVANTINLLNTMIRCNAGKIIFSSSCSTYGERVGNDLITEDTLQLPINPYARSKYFCEQIILDMSRSHGLDYSIFRYFNAAGADDDGCTLGEDHDPEPHLIPVVLNAARTGTPVTIFGRDYPTSDGTCVRDYIHVSDIARAHVLALTSRNASQKIYNLGTGKGYSVLSIIEKCREITGLPIEIIEGKRRCGDPAILVANPELVTKELGWKPVSSSLETIIQTAWEWMKKRS